MILAIVALCCLCGLLGGLLLLERDSRIEAQRLAKASADDCVREGLNLDELAEAVLQGRDADARALARAALYGVDR